MKGAKRSDAIARAPGTPMCNQTPKEPLGNSGNSSRFNVVVVQMDATADQFILFPELYADLPRSERSKWKQLKEMMDISQENGQLIPQNLAAVVLDVSNQRISDLINNQTLRCWEFLGKKFVCEKDLLAYATSERKAGRPIRERSNMELLGQCRAATKASKK